MMIIDHRVQGLINSRGYQFQFIPQQMDLFLIDLILFTYKAILIYGTLHDGEILVIFLLKSPARLPNYGPFPTEKW